MNKKTIWFLIVLIIANLIACFFALYQKDCLEIDFLDVGQGDAIFIETSLGNQILIDGGKDDAILYNLEKEMNFYDKDIDLVILTHADKDHFGGLMSVLETYKVDNFIWNGADSESQDFIKFKEQFNELNVLEIKKGDKIIVDDIELIVLNPVENLKEVSSLNDASIVLKLLHGDASFMLTGDITSKIEKTLLQDELDSDILKVGHHGSKYSTSEEFVKAVSPDYAIISVGENSYGHPADIVLENLENNNVKVLRTDRDGILEFYSNGKSILFKREK